MTARTFLTLAAGLTALAAAPAADPAGKFWVYYGTYSGGTKTGKGGIFRGEFDPATGKLTDPTVAADVGNPSFVAPSPDGKFLYSVGEGGGKDGGPVYAFQIDPATGGLTKLAGSTSGGAGPCHVSTDSAGKFAVVANYGGGSSAVYKIGPDGSIAARTHTEQHKGEAKQTPRGHCGAFHPNDKVAYVVDLGLDKVLVFDLNRDTGAAAQKEPIALPAGTGPRHIHVTPAGDWAFVNGELNLTVNAIKLDPATGTGKVVQTLTTLPDGQKGPVKGYSTAEVRIHPSGKFVYVSNRGHNSIAGFKWEGEKLTPIGHATEGIKTPRNFNIDPTGKWMLVANQDGNDVVVFEIDPATGALKPTGTKVGVPKPVCVKFVAKK